MELRDAIRDRFRRVRVLVVGDVMLDEYLLGRGQSDFAGSTSPSR